MLAASTACSNHVSQSFLPGLDRCSHPLGRQFLPTLENACFQFVHSERCSSLVVNFCTELIPNSVVHWIQIGGVRWPAVFLDVRDLVIFKVVSFNLTSVRCGAILLQEKKSSSGYSSRMSRRSDSSRCIT